MSAPMPEVRELEFVQSTAGSSTDVTWFLIYTGTLFFCVGGAGYHDWLFCQKMEEIPQPAHPREWTSKMNSVVAAGRIKEIKGARLHLWGSKNLGVETPQDWWSDLKKILEEQVVPQVLAVL